MEKGHEDIEMKKEARALGGRHHRQHNSDSDHDRADNNPTILCCGAKTWFNCAVADFICLGIMLIGVGGYFLYKENSDAAIDSFTYGGICFLEAIAFCCVIQCDNTICWCILFVFEFVGMCVCGVFTVFAIIHATQKTPGEELNMAIAAAVIIAFIFLVSVIYTCAAGALACSGRRRRGGKSGGFEEGSDEKFWEEV